MKVCKVLAPVVSTVKHPTYEGQKLLLVCELDPKGEETAHDFVALDRVQAGEGDTVLVMAEGNGVRQLMGVQDLPVRSIIVGIVDEVDVGEL